RARGEMVVIAKSSRELSLADDADLNRNRQQPEKTVGLCPHFVDEFRSSCIAARRQSNKHTQLENRPFRVSPHDRETFGPYPLERLLFPLNRNAEGRES